MEQFKLNTSNTSEFTECFASDSPVVDASSKWLNIFERHRDRAFKKIRLRKRKIKPSDADKLITYRNKLVKQSKRVISVNISDRIEKINSLISKIISAESRSNAFAFKKFCYQNSAVSVSKMWDLKKKIFPRKASLIPIAKKDHKNKINSSPHDIKKSIFKEYNDRLRRRKWRPDFDIIGASLKDLKQENTNLKLILSSKKKSNIFSKHELGVSLKDLNRGKSRDPYGHIAELFKPSAIGSNVKESLLIMVNKIKAEVGIPAFMRVFYITTIPKKFLSSTLLKN